MQCSECGWTTTKWVGRCGECQAWGTVGEVATGPRTQAATVLTEKAMPIDQIDVSTTLASPTGVAEFDRVLGGGLIPGGVVLVAGEPGVGKSTLLLDVSARVASQGKRVLYISGEESVGQIRLRAERIGAVRPHLYLAAHTDLAQVLGQIAAVDPQLLVLDSVQTIASDEVEGSAGGVAQVREVAASLIAAAKARNLPVLLVGHVTKDGGVAGPRTLEHLVDVVLQFEGDRHSSLRLVRALKNRYGSTEEVGCFELGENGIVSLADPSGLFLSHTGQMVPGTAITVTLEGRRPLVVEVQALVAPSPLSNPRRVTSGIESARLGMITAVLTRRCGIKLHDKDVYVATVGGVRLSEPACDLAIALAVASAADLAPLPAGHVAFGEVGLAGEIRQVTGLGRRANEASRLGFVSALAPIGGASGIDLPAGFHLRGMDTLVETLSVLEKSN